MATVWADVAVLHYSSTATPFGAAKVAAPKISIAFPLVLDAVTVVLGVTR